MVNMAKNSLTMVNNLQHTGWAKKTPLKFKALFFNKY